MVELCQLDIVINAIYYPGYTIHFYAMMLSCYCCYPNIVGKVCIKCTAAEMKSYRAMKLLCYHKGDDLIILCHIAYFRKGTIQVKLDNIIFAYLFDR